MSDLQERGLQLAPMTAADVGEVCALEASVFPFPWSRGNFIDSLNSGYDCWTVRDDAGQLAGYYLLMYALDEAHLLDVAVAANRQRQGLGRRMVAVFAAGGAAAAPRLRPCVDPVGGAAVERARAGRVPAPWLCPYRAPKGLLSGRRRGP